MSDVPFLNVPTVKSIKIPLYVLSFKKWKVIYGLKCLTYKIYYYYFLSILIREVFYFLLIVEDLLCFSTFSFNVGRHYV